MDEKKEILTALHEELQSFFTWIINEIGADYYIGDQGQPSESLEEESQKVLSRRIQAKRMQLWERDWYAFSNQAKHPSIYVLFGAEDLEIIHYPEDLSCEHFKGLDELDERLDPVSSQPEKKYDQSFGVLLSSQELGWMYRFDFCETCGLVEIWSMEYNPDEVSLYAQNL